MTTEEREQSWFEIHSQIMCLATQDDIKKVQESIKMRRKDLSRETISEVSGGDNVLIDNKGRVERGVLKKINRNRAVIDIETQGSYNVPFSMIRKEQ